MTKPSKCKRQAPFRQANSHSTATSATPTRTPLFSIIRPDGHIWRMYDVGKNGNGCTVWNLVCLNSALFKDDAFWLYVRDSIVRDQAGEEWLARVIQDTPDARRLVKEFPGLLEDIVQGFNVEGTPAMRSQANPEDRVQ